MQNLEKIIFCCFAGGRKTLEKLQNLEKSIFCWFPGRLQHYPTLSVLISDPRKIAKPGKSIFCWFPGRLQHYPTLSVLILDPRKIAKPGKMHFLLVRRRAKTWKNCKTWKMHFLLVSGKGPNAIQRYPSLSQTLEKLQNLEK